MIVYKIERVISDTEFETVGTVKLNLYSHKAAVEKAMRTRKLRPLLIGHGVCATVLQWE